MAYIQEYTGVLPSEAVGETAKIQACNEYMLWLVNTFTLDANELAAYMANIAALAGLNENAIVVPPKKVEQKNNYAVGVGASSVVSGDIATGGWGYLKLGKIGVASSVAGYNYAWGADLTGSEHVDVSLPFGVVIGDSIAEGRPTYNGRLNAAGTKYNYDPNYESVPGQMSYELTQQTGLYWYNHGIRGDTTTDVVGRWRRDVLGEVYDAGDGIGSQTLPTGRKPYAVWVNIGTNDNYNDNTKDAILENYRYMAESARENGIICIFNTIGWNGDIEGSAAWVKRVEINAFIREELPKYGSYIFDFNKFFEDPANQYNMNPALSVDAIHPSPAGHIAGTKEAIKHIGAPIIMQDIAVESRVDPLNKPPAYVSVGAIKVEREVAGVESIAFLNNGIANISPYGRQTKHDEYLRVSVLNGAGYLIDATKWGAISSVYPRLGTASIEDEYYGRATARIAPDGAGVWSLSDNLNVGIESVTQDSSRILIALKGQRFMSGNVTPIAYSNNYSFGLGFSGTFPSGLILIYIKDLAGANINPSTITGGGGIFVDVNTVAM